MTTALITGSTAGIGAAFARRLAADGHSLVLVARDAERLGEQATELHDRHGIEAEVLSADLATDAGIEAVATRLGDRKNPVDLLVNNAGFGNKGRYLDVPMADELRMLKVHCEAVLRLTGAAAEAMRERGAGVSSMSRPSPPSCRAVHTGRRRRGSCSSRRGRRRTWRGAGCG